MSRSACLFRPVSEADIAVLRRWRREPHVLRWWGPAENEDPADMLGHPDVRMWIVTCDGRPFAYVQDYDPHAWAGHPFTHLPPGSRGIDQYIGEPHMIGQGYGTAFVRRHCERLFAEGAPAIGTDPHPDNRAAIRAYEKAGFAVTSGPMDTLWGRAVLMERWR